MPTTSEHQKSSSYQKNVETGQPCYGIVIANLGTPDAPTTGALRRYLREFLSDHRVVDLPRILWLPILHGIVLQTRPRKSAAAYRKIWTEQGSPLLAISKKQTAAIAANLRQAGLRNFHVRLGMRYGNPSIASALQQLRSLNCNRLIVLPLYPQYSSATTASTADAVFAELKKWRHLPDLRLLGNYYQESTYIDSLSASIREHWHEHGKVDHLLFSFHGLPKRYERLGDPYANECRATAHAVANKLQLPQERWTIAFQSRFGPEEWLQPYTEELMHSMPKNGIKKLQTISPGFSADCLETLEEIEMQYKEIFLASGGEKFTYIRALNERDDHCSLLSQLVFDAC